jgi:hypothetical protein
MKSRSLASVLLLSTILAACGSSSDGGGSSERFDVLVQPDISSTSAAGEVLGLPRASNVSLTVVLPAGIEVSGTVTDGLGAPLAGATVDFLVSANGPSFAQAATNGNGDYSVRLAQGTWIAVVDSGDPTIGTSTITGLAISPPGPVTGNFSFPAKLAVSGTVFEDMGPAIPGATLDFVGSTSGATVSVVADGAGFYMASLRPDTYTVTVTPAGPAAATHLKERFTTPISGAGTVNYSLTEGVQVSGTVLDNVATPLLEETVITVSLPAGSVFCAPAPVNASSVDGTYTIELVPPGNVTFDLVAPGSTGFPRQQATRTIAGPTTQTEDFMLNAGFVFSGTILRDDGLTPEANVLVEPVPQGNALAPATASTDAFGNYEIAVFPATYDVTLTPEITNFQLPQTDTLVVAANTVHDVILTAGSLVMGTVTQPGGIIPQPGVIVEIPDVLGASDTTDGSGAYSFLAPQGTWTLHVTATEGPFVGIALARVTNVTVTPGGPTLRDIQLALATSGSTVVTGTVFESNGTTGAVGATLTALDPDTGEVLGKTEAAAGGVYTLVIP